MIKSVLKRVGHRVSVYSKDGEFLGETFGRIKLVRLNNAAGITDAGEVDTYTYIFVGSGEGGGAHIKEDCTITYKGLKFLVVRSDFSSVNSVNIVWASMRKVGE